MKICCFFFLVNRKVYQQRWHRRVLFANIIYRISVAAVHNWHQTREAAVCRAVYGGFEGMLKADLVREVWKMSNSLYFSSKTTSWTRTWSWKPSKSFIITSKSTIGWPATFTQLQIRNHCRSFCRRTTIVASPSVAAKNPLSNGWWSVWSSKVVLSYGMSRHCWNWTNTQPRWAWAIQS